MGSSDIIYGIPQSPAITKGDKCHALTSLSKPCKKKADANGIYCSTHQYSYRLECPEECVICTNSLSPTCDKPTKCGHYMHKTCIDSWLSRHTTCPVCRTELKTPEMTHSLFFILLQQFWDEG